MSALPGARVPGPINMGAASGGGPPVPAGLPFRVIVAGTTFVLAGTSVFESVFTRQPGEVLFCALWTTSAGGAGRFGASTPTAIASVFADSIAAYLIHALAVDQARLQIFNNTAADETIEWCVIGIIPGGSPIAPVQFRTDILPVTVNGQTAFVLPALPFPAQAASLNLYINGTRYTQGSNFTLAGAALTWLDVPMTLQTTDQVVANYQT